MTHYWQEYAEHRTGIEVHKLLHYAHFIPVATGGPKPTSPNTSPAGPGTS